MKVCLIGTEGDFNKSIGQGVHRYIYELAMNLQKVKRKDTQIHVEKFSNMPFLYSGLTPFVHSIIDDFSKYDIVHSPDARPLSYMRYGKAISVNTAHDFHSVVVPEFSPEDYENVHRLLGLYLVLHPGIRTTLNSDYIIANSTQTKGEAIKLGFDSKRIFVSNLGIDERFLKNAKEHKKNGFKVGYIGSLSVAKNVIFSIKAFMKTHEKDTVFEIWGNKVLQYDNLVRASRSDKRIRFMGFAPERQLVKIYDSFDAFVHPTLYEGFGLPILEAQARGLPVLIYKKAMIPEEVRRYCIETKSEEDMAQEIEKIRLNGYNEKQRKTAQNYARKFTWMKNAEETMRIYQEIYSMNL